MPTALSTTKRKFHKLLDSISNASSTSLAPDPDTKSVSTPTLPTNTESPAKRLRIARPASAIIPSTTHPHTAPVRHSMIISKSTATSTLPAMNEEQQAPNFVPWDRDQFLARLKTFRHVDKWMSKPEQVDEVQWAKRGWSCVGRERVGCVGGCAKEVVVKLEDDPLESSEDQEADRTEKDDDEEEDWREKAREQLVEKYAEMITTGHGGGCLWRRRGCDDTIYRLPLAHQATALTSLRQRYDSLAKMAAELPSNISAPPIFEPPQDSPQLISLLHLNSQEASNTQSNEPTTPPPTRTPPPPPPPTPQSQINHAALTLALFGWQAETDHIPGLATCSACFRRLGLWLFRPSSSPTSSEIKEPAMSRLDVVGEHRHYCPWINPESQNGPPASRPRSSSSASASLHDLAGWEILARWVANALRPRRIDARAESVARSEPSDTPATLQGDDDADATSVVDSLAATSTAVDGASSRDEKDKQRWARFKQIKQAFNVKRGMGKSKGKTTAATAAATKITTTTSSTSNTNSITAAKI